MAVAIGRTITDPALNSPTPLQYDDTAEAAAAAAAVVCCQTAP